MRKRLILQLLAVIMIMAGCMVDVSEGTKFGILQKVSVKHWPCEYYVAEFAYEGGRISQSESGKSSSFSNTQQVEIDKAAFDTLENLIGDKVLFSYKDKGYEGCGEAKLLTSIKKKKYDAN